MFSNNVLASNQIVLGNEILDPKDAFKMTINKIEDSLFLNWKIEKTYYLYQNSIKVIHKDQSIAFDLIGDPIVHKDEFLGESLIYRKSLDLLVRNLDRYINKSLMLTYQGLSLIHI